MRTGWWILWSLVVIAGCRHRNADLIAQAPLASRTVTDGRGVTVTLRQPASRLVVLSPGLSDALAQLGAADRAVSIPDTATLSSLRGYGVELLVCTSAQASPTMLLMLAKQGIPVYVQPDSNLAAVWQSIRDLGLLTGTEARAAVLADSLARFTEELRTRTEGQIRYRTALVLGGPPAQAVGGSGYLAEALAVAGAGNVFAPHRRNYVPLVADSLMRHETEFVILPATDEAWLRDYVSAHPQLVNLPALLQRQVFQVEPQLLQAGPNLALGLAELTRMLHPAVDASGAVAADSAAVQ